MDKIIKRKGGREMKSQKTRKQLQREIEELEQENKRLRRQLDKCWIAMTGRNEKGIAVQRILEDDSEEYKERAKQDMCNSVARHIYSANLMSFTERGGGLNIKILEGIVRILAPEDGK